jgi:hypothetical protein
MSNSEVTKDLESASVCLDNDVAIVLLLIGRLYTDVSDREATSAMLSRASDHLRESNARLQAAIEAPAAQ